MDWDAIGAVGEIVGAAAVVVSIIYLAAQIHANTKTIRANAGFEATHSWANFNEAFSQRSDEDLVLITRCLTDAWEDFSEIERTRTVSFFRASYQKLEGQYFLYRYGSLDAALWTNRARFSAGLLDKPFFRTWWEIEKSQKLYSDEFVDALESIEPLAVSNEVLGRTSR